MKTALCFNDISAVGRASLSASMPVLSVMGVQCCPLPTVVLSTHTGGFDPVVRVDQTDFFRRSLDAYRVQKMQFDCICTGYFASTQAVEAAADYLSQQSDTLRICDPVMGDDGKLYPGFGPEMATALAGLCQQADLITPHPTEAAFLLKRQPSEHYTLQQGQQLCCELSDQFGAGVILTGLALDNGQRVCIGQGKKRWENFVLDCHYAPESYPGTGDLFTAVLTGALLCGNALQSAAELAVRFTEKAAHATYAKHTDPRFGVEFEPFLPELEVVACR